MKAHSKILVIEFEHDIRVSYRKALEQDGYSVVSTADGATGIKILQRDFESIRLVILSLRMPIMDGNDFLTLKSEDPKTKDIPVVVIALSPNELCHPVTEALQKPISKSHLLTIVQKYFSPERK